MRVDVTQAPYLAPSDGLRDAGPAVRRALADLENAGGGVLYFPAGTYWMRPPAATDPAGSRFGLTITADNVHVEGDGPGRTTLTTHREGTTDFDDGGVVVFRGPPASSASGVSIRDLSLVGASAETTTTRAALCFVSSVGFEASGIAVSAHNGPGILVSGELQSRAADGQVRRCEVTACRGSGIRVQLADRVTVVDSTVAALVDTASHGISLEFVTACEVRRCVVTDTTRHGILLKSASGMVVAGCEVWALATDQAFGILVHNGCSDVRVTGCHVHDTPRDGIHVIRAARVVVAENLVHATGDDGIAIQGFAGADPRPFDVVVANNIVFDAGSRGVAVMGRSGLLIEGNVIHSTFMSGIGIEVFHYEGEDFGPIHDVVVRGNLLTDPGRARFVAGITHGQGQAFGILVQSVAGHTVERVVIEGNTIRGCRNSYTRVRSATTEGSLTVADVVIRGNTFSGPVVTGSGGTGSHDPGEYHGIWVSACDRVTVESNEIRDADQGGIVLDGSCSGELLVGANTVVAANVSATPGVFGISVGEAGVPASVWGNRVSDPGDDSTPPQPLLAGTVRVGAADARCYVSANVGVGPSGTAVAVPDTGSAFRADPVKAPVRAATTQPLVLADALTPGGRVDEVALAVGDRVLVKDQATAAQNGIYVVTREGPKRAADFDAAWKVPSAALVLVQAGAVNAASGFVLATESPFTIDVTPLVFAPVSPSGHRHPTTMSVRGLADFHRGVSTRADGSDTLLTSFTIAPGTLATDGDTVWFEYYGTTKAGANTKTIRVTWGDRELLTTGAHATTDQPATWRLWGHLMRVDETTVRFGASLWWVRADGSIEASVQRVDALTALDLGATGYALATWGSAGAPSSEGDVASSTGVITARTAG